LTLAELVGGYRASQAIHVAATFGIADLPVRGAHGVEHGPVVIEATAA
jgi:hypothetical protein